MSETMCNVNGCLYLRLNIPSTQEGALDMIGVHIHPEDGAEVTAQLLIDMMAAAVKDLSPDLIAQFEVLSSLAV